MIFSMLSKWCVNLNLVRVLKTATYKATVEGLPNVLAGILGPSAAVSHGGSQSPANGSYWHFFRVVSDAQTLTAENSGKELSRNQKIQPSLGGFVFDVLFLMLAIQGVMYIYGRTVRPVIAALREWWGRTEGIRLKSIARRVEYVWCMWLNPGRCQAYIAANVIACVLFPSVCFLLFENRLMAVNALGGYIVLTCFTPRARLYWFRGFPLAFLILAYLKAKGYIVVRDWCSNPVFCSGDPVSDGQTPSPTSNGGTSTPPSTPAPTGQVRSVAEKFVDAHTKTFEENYPNYAAAAKEAGLSTESVAIVYKIALLGASVAGTLGAGSGLARLVAKRAASAAATAADPVSSAVVTQATKAAGAGVVKPTLDHAHSSYTSPVTTAQRAEAFDLELQRKRRRFEFASLDVEERRMAIARRVEERDREDLAKMPSGFAGYNLASDPLRLDRAREYIHDRRVAGAKGVLVGATIAASVGALWVVSAGGSIPPVTPPAPTK